MRLRSLLGRIGGVTEFISGIFAQLRHQFALDFNATSSMTKTFAPSSSADSAPCVGRVVASHGRHLMVESEDGKITLCHARGKRNEAVVGDWVNWTPSTDEGVIESIAPRTSLLYRQDELRSKLFAANIDLAVIFLAVEPEYSDMQLARSLIATQAAGIKAMIVLNKCDLEGHAQAMTRLKPYVDMGIETLFLSLRDEAAYASGFARLSEHLRSCRSLILGPSGAGKSTLINRLLPHIEARTQEISQALKSGKHTTTTATWYWLDAQRQGAIIDSPGFQEFGLHHLEAEDLAGYMPDLARHLGSCRFYNCQHLHEPGCGVRAHVGSGQADQIDAKRYAIYESLHQELQSAKQRW
ncbi:MAG: putative ribosome biosis GTPase RsgA [Pseudomonadota bacterium]